MSRENTIHTQEIKPKDIPESVGKIIVENWDVIEKYSKLEDKTRRVLGMKFPIEGWSE